MAEHGSAGRLWRLSTKRVAEDGTTVLIVEGRLGRAAAAPLEAAANPLISAGITELVIDLSGVDYLSSESLKVLERLAAAQERGGGRLTLRAPSPVVRLSLQFSGEALARRIR